MLNLFYWYLPARSMVCISLFVSAFIFSLPDALADGSHHKAHSVESLDQLNSLPANLNNIPLVRLKKKKRELESLLESLQVSGNTLVANEKSLLDSLIAYDNVRLEITDVIVNLIEEYEVTGRYKEKLLGFRDTFLTKIRPARDNVLTLDEYKAYSTHFAVAYVSLIYTFKENAQFYSRYKHDIGDERSIIGRYISELAVAYKKVEHAQNKYQSSLLATSIIRKITELDSVINLRRKSLITQYPVNHQQTGNTY